jgi:hypothetical protein
MEMPKTTPTPSTEPSSIKKLYSKLRSFIKFKPTLNTPREEEPYEQPPTSTRMKRASIAGFESLRKVKKDEFTRHSIDGLRGFEGLKGSWTNTTPREPGVNKPRFASHRASMSFFPALNFNAKKMSDEEILDSSFHFYDQRDSAKQLSGIDSSLASLEDDLVDDLVDDLTDPPEFGDDAKDFLSLCDSMLFPPIPVYKIEK